MLCVFQGLAVMSLNLLWQARQQRAKSNMTTHARACAHTHTYIQRDVDQTSCNGIKYTWCYKGSCWEVADECLLLHRPVHVSLSHKASQLSTMSAVSAAVPPASLQSSSTHNICAGLYLPGNTANGVLTVHCTLLCTKAHSTAIVAWDIVEWAGAVR